MYIYIYDFVLNGGFMFSWFNQIVHTFKYKSVKTKCEVESGVKTKCECPRATINELHFNKEICETLGLPNSTKLWDDRDLIKA